MMAGPQHVHTDGNAIPALDDEMAGLFDDLASVQDAGIDQILAGLRLIALARHTADHTQTLIATLAGGSDATNVTALIGQVIARLANADQNPALRHLPLEQQKTARHHGELAHYALADPDLHQTAAETAAAIDGI